MCKGRAGDILALLLLGGRAGCRRQAFQTSKRKSPVKLVTYQVLRDRPGQWLTARQIFTAIRKDTHKRVSRQSINVNLNLLEKSGQIRRRPAPKGSGGARYVFSAV